MGSDKLQNKNCNSARKQFLKSHYLFQQHPVLSTALDSGNQAPESFTRLFSRTTHSQVLFHVNCESRTCIPGAGAVYETSLYQRSKNRTIQVFNCCFTTNKCSSERLQYIVQYVYKKFSWISRVGQKFRKERKGTLSCSYRTTYIL